MSSRILDLIENGCARNYTNTYETALCQNLIIKYVLKFPTGVQSDKRENTVYLQVTRLNTDNYKMMSPLVFINGLFFPRLIC